MIAGIRLNKRANFNCIFCKHASWKRMSAAEAHVLKIHPAENENAELKRKIETLQTVPPKIITKEKIVEKERIVYRDAPKPKYWYTNIYCETCRIVIQNAGIPNGQSIESTPHSICGTRSLKLVVAIQ